MHLLYIDDDTQAARHLVDQLSELTPAWTTTCCKTLLDAERAITSTRIDVMIGKPKIQGDPTENLFKLMADTNPGAIRIMAENLFKSRDIFMPTILVHQYLLAPVDAQKLLEIVNRLRKLMTEIYSEPLQEIVGRIDSIPSLPALYSEIVTEINKPSGSLERVGVIISRDLQMSSKILQLANSPFFAFNSKVMDVGHAVFILGLNTITGMVLASGIFSKTSLFSVSGLDADALMDHSVNVGLLARSIALKEGLMRDMVDVSYVAGFLHDIGRLVLADKFPDEYGDARSYAWEYRAPILDAEKAIFGVDHAQVGGCLLGLWGFPDEMIEAVYRHHDPATSNDRMATPLTAVHAANAIEKFESASSVFSNMNQEEKGGTPAIHSEYLEQISLDHRPDTWRTLYQDSQVSLRDAYFRGSERNF